MKRIILILMLLTATINSKAQKIKGRVVEILPTGEENPLIGANVYWKGTDIGVSTNIEGYYLINEPESYPSTMIVTFVGYKPYKQRIRELGNYHIVLQSSIDISEVDIKGNINTTQISTIEPLNIQTITNDEIAKAACCNLSECFETNTSIDVSYSDAISGLKTIQMLALDGLYMQINNESMPLVNGLLNSYGLSYVPGSWIESIQVTKGIGSVLNGHTGLTGQINLEYFKPDNSDRYFWNAYTNSEGKIENNFVITTTNGKWKSNLFTHVSYLGNEIDHHGSHHDHTTHTDLSGDGFLDVPRVKQFNFLNRLQYTGFDDMRMQVYIKGLWEDRIGGQQQDIPNYYLVDIHNDLLELNTKTGYILPSDNNKSIGLQSSWKIHNQNAQFGNNKYSGQQGKAYLNLMINTYFGNLNHILRYGFSYNADRFIENFTGNINTPYDIKRVDRVSGIFTEYNYSKDEKFNLNTGIRADYYNITNKVYYSPRFHIKYNPNNNTAVRFSFGQAFRIPNILVENLYHLSSSRNIIIDSNINPELALNYGGNFSYCFYLFSREGTFNFDMYRTVFEEQMVVDLENQSELRFYNLDGESSYANSIQFDLVYELFDRFDIKTGYKFNQSYTTYNGDLQLTPLIPKSRALFNLAYATNLEKWKFDFTANYIGESRIPNHSEINITNNTSEPFTIFNAQITKKIKSFDLYLGGENLLNYTQENPIISAEDPFGVDFDASLIWAPVMGRMVYAGLRYKIK